MGWDFTHGATKQDTINYLIGETASRCCLHHSVRGNVLWTVEIVSRPENPTVIIGCYLLGSDRGGGYGYKAMCESMHPFYYSCPLKFLDIAPVACEEWRVQVRAFHANAKAKASMKLAPGVKVRLVPGCSVRGVPITEATITSVKPLIVTIEGIGSVSLKRSLIKEVQE